MTLVVSLFQVFAQTSVFVADDLYLEGRTSGNFPLDDEDGEDNGSGSGSGEYGKKSVFFFFFKQLCLLYILIYVQLLAYSDRIDIQYKFV